jgi:hypothetical protein
MLNDSPLEFHELKISDQAKVLAKLLEKFGGADLRSIHELAEHEKNTVQCVWKQACQDVRVPVCSIPLRLLTK